MHITRAPPPSVCEKALYSALSCLWTDGRMDTHTHTQEMYGRLSEEQWGTIQSDDFKEKR